LPNQRDHHSSKNEMPFFPRSRLESSRMLMAMLRALRARPKLLRCASQIDGDKDKTSCYKFFTNVLHNSDTRSGLLIYPALRPGARESSGGRRLPSLHWWGPFTSPYSSRRGLWARPGIHLQHSRKIFGILRLHARRIARTRLAARFYRAMKKRFQGNVDCKIHTGKGACAA
jgi:hypothetical protein